MPDALRERVEGELRDLLEASGEFEEMTREHAPARRASKPRRGEVGGREDDRDEVLEPPERQDADALQPVRLLDEAEGLDFIVRLVGNRNLLHWNGTRLAEDLAVACEMKHHDHVMFRSHGREVSVRVSYGSLPVKLPDLPGTELRLVVVRWPRGERPMMLLTTLRVARSRRSLRQVVENF